MIRTISALTVAALTSTISVQAADLVVFQPQPIATYAPTFSWTGFYAGADVGHGWGKADFTAGPGAASFDARGIVGGVHAGYNHDFGGFVLGAEADFSLSDVHFIDTAFGVISTVRLENYGSVRARVGLPVDRFLPYVTGGIGFGTGTFNIFAPPTDTTDRQTHFGWTIGAGAEYAVTDNMILRAEYLYTDLGTRNYHANNRPGGIDTKMNFGTLRAGVSFKF
ncbi:outer membrane protein [Devosia faecipullorum]|uniref:outer membrane protein n=1 Tax=Devosia faecipullorum TaxID=2755039 RepID=UPI00187BAA89|nr:outer membrane protein [Devosia faecipullorum]MBE7733939.1 porin family protein [Devosia faecipullorum]